MRTNLGRFAAAILLSLLAFPARADTGAPTVPAQDSKDLCSYLKDVDGKTDAACEPEALLALKAKDQNAFAEKLALAAKRKADVQRAYERLKASSAKDTADLPRLEPPINERTFPAWIGADSPDFKAVYGKWIRAQSDDLRREEQGPISDARRKEIDRKLAANQTRLTGLETIKDPQQLSCYLGESCGIRGDAGPKVAGTEGRKILTADDLARLNAQARGEKIVVPGGRLDRNLPSLEGLIPDVVA